MVNAPNTGSTLALSSANKTSTAISTNIIIMVNDTAVGAVQSLSVQESRDIRMIDEIGTDGHIDSVPNKSTEISGSCQRIRFDKLRIAEAFGRGFIHPSAQVYPFDIVIIDKQSRDTANHISTIIKNVWISNIDVTYSATEWVISETMQWKAEAIYSILPGNKSVANGGARGIKHSTFTMGDNGTIQNIEQLADSGANGRRGALDAAGLIDLVSDGQYVF